MQEKSGIWADNLAKSNQSTFICWLGERNLSGLQMEELSGIWAEKKVRKFVMLVQVYEKVLACE